MNKRLKSGIMIFAILATVFSVSYFLTNLYIENNMALNNNTKEVNESKNNKKQSYLSEETNISLNKGTTNEYKESLSSLKEDLGLDENLTEEELSSILSKEGYNLTQECSNELYYTRTVAPNKYYIREYKGYLAIFKSDENCKLTIENEETDVFSDSKKFENLRQVDQDSISSFEREFNTKEEAEEAISELIS